jgi:hypothetical protein
MHTITGAATSNTAFIDGFTRGPINRAQLLLSFKGFERFFGGLVQGSEASYQVMQYFTNGGKNAYAVRVVPSTAATASLDLGGAVNSRLRIKAASPGAWGNRVRAVAVRSEVSYTLDPTFTLSVQDMDAGGKVVRSEIFKGLSAHPAHPEYFVKAVNSQSELVELSDTGAAFPMPALVPHNSPDLASGAAYNNLADGADGVWNAATGEFATALRNAVTDATSPLSSLAPGLFNILCIPATATLDAKAAGHVMAQAQSYCEPKRAFYIIDIPGSKVIPSPGSMADWFRTNRQYLTSDCAAVYYPRLRLPDPLDQNRPLECGNSGTLAGLYASTDMTRGVWKAPSGAQAVLAGATLVYTMNDGENAVLNPLGINALRIFPVYGAVSWGARTLQGADELASTWKYIPVRRLAQYIENSLHSGLTWAALEPNSASLWSSIALSVSAFMSGLFSQGALHGVSPKDAYYVRSDATTTLQSDVNGGRVNVVVGFAPLKPGEFLVLQIRVAAGPAT